MKKLIPNFTSYKLVKTIFFGLVLYAFLVFAFKLNIVKKNTTTLKSSVTEPTVKNTSSTSN